MTHFIEKYLIANVISIEKINLGYKSATP